MFLEATPLKEDWAMAIGNMHKKIGIYDMIQYIYMRSKADDMASLVWSMAQKWKIKEN